MLEKIKELRELTNVSLAKCKTAIDQLRADLVFKSGENIVIKRFIRWDINNQEMSPRLLWW